EWGLADALAASEKDLEAPFRELATQALREGKRPKKELPLFTWRQRLLESNPLGRSLLFRGAKRVMRRRVPDDMPSPWEALKAVLMGITHGMAEGLAAEREGVGRLATTKACRNLVTLFFLVENAKGGDKLLGQAGGREPSREVRRVGVVGAGTMGAGIAQL